MSLSQSKKAISERKRRLNEREKRRHNVFIHDYILTKYKGIYAECNAFYHELRNKYPTKLNITKTYHYRKWKNQLITRGAEMGESVAETVQIHPERVTSESGMNEVETDHPERVTSESGMNEPETDHPERVTSESGMSEPETDHPERVTSESGMN